MTSRYCKIEKSGMKFEKHVFEQIINWALTCPKPIQKIKGKTKKQLRNEMQMRERKQGNTWIRQKNNGQWTTRVGEGIVHDILVLLGQNPRKVIRKQGYEPDWECDDYMVEVKTSNWCVPGTAGEKVLGTWIKYQEVPELYGKPLKIICVANQEYELTYGKTRYFGDNITEKTKKILGLAGEWGIEYVNFSEFIKPVMNILENNIIN